MAKGERYRDQRYFDRVDWSDNRILTQQEIQSAKVWIASQWFPHQLGSVDLFPAYSPDFIPPNDYYGNRGNVLLWYLANPLDCAYQTGRAFLQEETLCYVLNDLMRGNIVYPAPEWIDRSCPTPTANLYQKGGDLVVCARDTGDIRYILDVSYKARKFAPIPGTSDQAEWIGMNSRYAVPVIVLSVGEGFSSSGAILSDEKMCALRDRIVSTGSLTVVPEDIDVGALSKSLASGIKICGNTLTNAIQSGQYGALTDCLGTCLTRLQQIDPRSEFGNNNI